jgi:hypothetical protein
MAMGASAPTKILKFNVNYQIFTSNAPHWPKLFAPPFTRTLAAPPLFYSSFTTGQTSGGSHVSDGAALSGYTEEREYSDIGGRRCPQTFLGDFGETDG